MNSNHITDKIIKEYSLNDIHTLLLQSDNFYYNNIKSFIVYIIFIFTNT